MGSTIFANWLPVRRSANEQISGAPPLADRHSPHSEPLGLDIHLDARVYPSRAAAGRSTTVTGGVLSASGAPSGRPPAPRNPSRGTGRPSRLTSVGRLILQEPVPAR